MVPPVWSQFVARSSSGWWCLRPADTGQNRRVLVDLKLRDLLLDLRLEFVRGTAKFIHKFADLAGDFRQLLGPKDDEGEEEQEDRFRKTHKGHHIAPMAKAAIGGIVLGS